MLNSTPNADGPHEASDDAGTSYTQAEPTAFAPAMGGDAVPSSQVASTEGGPCAGRALIDWKSATFENRTAQEVVEALWYGDDDFVQDKPTHEERGRTSNRYGHKLSNQGITILHKGPGGGGCRLDMTGEGCRQWERDHPGQTFQDLLVAVHRLAPRMHRLDIAMDDFTGVLDMATLETCRHEGFFVFKGRRDKTQYWAQGTGDSLVETVIFGSPRSDYRVKFYNRGHLLQALGLPGDPEAPVGDSGWVRAEVQLRNAQAQAVLDRIMELGSVGRAGAEALARVTFKDPKPNDSNQSRWTTASFWTRFLGNAQRARLGSPQPTSTLRSKMAWLYRQAAPAVALLMIEEGEEGLLALAHHGLRALKPHHLALLSPEKRRQAESALANVRQGAEEPEDDLSDEDVQAILADIAEEEARLAWVEEMLADERDGVYEADHCGWNGSVTEPETLRGHHGHLDLGGAA